MKDEIIPVEIAEKVVALINRVTGKNVNIMGQGGVIIASVQKERVGTVHEGAKRIMTGEIDELAVSEEEASRFKGVKAGYNGVILRQGRRIGCIGISGNPEIVGPIQKMGAIIVQEELDKRSSDEERREELDQIAQDITNLADQIKVVAINGSIQAARLGERGAPVKVVVSQMAELTDRINRMAVRIAGS
ncbi:hypothetical protein AU468_02470 [Alkalispirochaeta sphaeroplastigenens]|uniref:Methyl-accepting transducer domain-containing protein n=1 Tax=Alkalispirochaeta sphaeroplastigenens TaxID=1187066 RepID=A0A2S4JZ34_9SPIO|nr:sugar diacid recognition domain-containing protein [Alkalispirochaeta sphaeroplastigenens]POR04780.1 hypothetical protein AU468_02470 [Alkalispirochaeta sphaeroplastigenens]